MRRLPALVLGVLVVATVAAFFVTQHLKVTTPLLAGFPAPDPSAINPVAGGTCGGVQHRVTRVSFYLLHRSDDVDVYVIDQSGNVVATVASGRHMRRGVRHPDGEFVWDGRLSDGQVAPDGTYYFQVSLIHQGRTVVISNAAGPEPITVESTPPRPRVLRVVPGVIPSGGRPGTRIELSGNDERGGYVNLYRTDLPGQPHLAKTFGLPWGAHSVVWDGLIAGLPAPAGTYLVGLSTTDAACTTGRFPASVPPPRGSTLGAGVTVRYLAAQPPLDPVPAGSDALVRVHSTAGPYRWSLRGVGERKALLSGTGTAARLSVPLPAGRSGLYELALRAGTFTTSVPIVAAPPAPQRVLVVLPALSWQGLNPVDDDGDGVPDTLTGGGPIVLARPFAEGLPAGFGDEAALVAYLAGRRREYDLTTDLGLLDGIGPGLHGHRLVVLAGSERWLPATVAAELRSYVTGGGRVMSLGVDSLLRRVTVRGGRALDPSPPARVDVLGAARGALANGGGAQLIVVRDALGLFHAPLPAVGAFEPLSVAPAALVAAAEAPDGHAAIVGYRLGSGTVVDVGLVGFGSTLAHDRAARALMDGVFKALAG